MRRRTEGGKVEEHKADERNVQWGKVPAEAPASWTRVRRRFRPAWLAVGAWLLAVGLITAMALYAIFEVGTAWLFLPIAGAAGLSCAVVWFSRRHAVSGRLPGREGWRRAAWMTVFLVGLVYAASLLAAVGTAGGTSTVQIQVEYEAVITPQGPGPYVVIVPAMSLPREVEVVAGEARVERVEGEHGEGWRVSAEQAVSLRAALQERIRVEDLDAYHPTLRTAASSEAGAEERNDYWIYASAPVHVAVRMDVVVQCSRDTHEVEAHAQQGWRVYPGRLDAMHGDFCGADILLMPLGFILLAGLMLAQPLFIVGLLGLTAMEGWWRMRRARG